MAFELSKLREKIGKEIGEKVGRDLDALADKSKGEKMEADFDKDKKGEKAVGASETSAVAPEAASVETELSSADLGAGLNPSQPPFTEREEKTEAEEKFVVPEKFEGPEYDEVKKDFDGIRQFIASKGLDPGKYRFSYKMIVKTEPDPKNPNSKIGQLEEFKNYHDYLKRLQNLTDEEKGKLNTNWSSPDWGDWHSPDVFANFYNEMDIAESKSELYPHRDAIRKIIGSQQTGEAKDLYAEAIKNGEVKEIDKLEKKEFLPVEQLKKEVERTRAEYIESEADAKKADKSSSKLGKLREFFFGGKKEEAGGKKDSAAEKEKEATRKLNEGKKNAYEEAKKVFASGLYDEKIKSFEEKTKTGGKEGGPMTPEEHEKALADLKFEVVKEAILDERGVLNKEKIAALPEKERSLCMKALARYGQLPQPARILISAAAATGTTLAFSSGVGFAMVGGIFAWKAVRAGVGTTAGLLAGKGYNWAFDKLVNVKKIISDDEGKIINEIKSNLVNKGEQEDNSAENKAEKKKEEFEKWFSNLSASTNQKLDNLATKEKRILLGKAIGQGVVIAGVAGLTSMGMEKGMASLSPDLAAKMGIKISAPPDKAPKVSSVKAGAPDNFDSRFAAQKGLTPSDNFDSRFAAQKGLTPPARFAAQEGLTSSGAETLKTPEVQEVLNLKIGARGPEGAIIDNFRKNPDLAKTFGYDPDGKISLDKWAGTKAHQLWLESVEGDLKNPKIVAELTKHGYQATPEDYAKAMHRIGKGSVVLDPQGHMHLADDASFLKAVAPELPLEELGGAKLDVLDDAKEKIIMGKPLGAGGPEKVVELWSEEFYDLQQITEETIIPSEEQLSNIKNTLKSADESLSMTEDRLKQADLLTEERNILVTNKNSLIEYKGRLEKVLETKSEMPQTIKDLLPPEIISRDTFKDIMSPRKLNFSDLAKLQKEVVDKLYAKHTGCSFDEFNQLSEKLKGKYLAKLDQGISEIVKSDAVLVEGGKNLPQKAMTWRNLGEMKYLQEIQEKFGNSQNVAKETINLSDPGEKVEVFKGLKETQDTA